MLRTRLAAFIACASFSLAGIYACSDDDGDSNPATPDGGTDGGGTDGGNVQTDGGVDTGIPDSGKPDTGLAPDDICPSTGDKNPYCEEKVFPTYTCNGIAGSGDNTIIYPGDPDSNGKWCNNCLSQYCCGVSEACFGNGKPPSDGGSPLQYECTSFDACLINCIGDSDMAACRANCESQQDAGVVAAHKAAMDCLETKCQFFPAFFQDGGTLCLTLPL
jgi:hypothetical protein